MIRVDGLVEITRPELRVLRALWAAVLVQARKDLNGAWLHCGDVDDAPRTRARAEQWVRSYAQAPRSFEWVCAVLDLDPGRTREAMLTKRKRAKTARKLTEVRA